MKKRDTLFSSPMERVSDFDFGSATAEVFDDMILRSVPFYEEIQAMIAELSSVFLGESPLIYDLGCSTGETMAVLGNALKKQEGLTIAGVDNSDAMLSKAEEKLRSAGVTCNTRLIKGDLNTDIEFESADIFILNLTLQFVRPLYREKLLANIFKNLKRGGAIVIVEKVLSDHSELNSVYVKNYYEFKKRKGYSELEISQKRERLENILVPYTVNENLELLKNSGFDKADIFFRWYNFAGFVGIK